jgi:hypothetical protein
VPHHLRHDANGASIGAGLKDDRRAISLSWDIHVERHAGNGWFSGMKKAEVQAWENEQLAVQRSAYLAFVAAEKKQENQ